MQQQDVEERVIDRRLKFANFVFDSFCASISLSLAAFSRNVVSLFQRLPFMRYFACFNPSSPPASFPFHPIHGTTRFTITEIRASIPDKVPVTNLCCCYEAASKQSITCTLLNFMSSAAQDVSTKRYSGQKFFPLDSD